MLNISIDLELGQARLSQATAVKAGGGVPVRITFSSNPGTSPAIELALSPSSSSPSVLAFLDSFETQSQTVYTGLLDANDTRLIDHLTGKQAQTLDCEVVLTVGAAPRRPFPNFPISVQPPIITGPESSEGGPVYLTAETGDTRYLQTGEALAEINAAGSGSRASARSNIGLAAMLCREAVDGPVTFNTAGSAGQYWFDATTSRLWIYAGAQFRYLTLISEA